MRGRKKKPPQRDCGKVAEEGSVCEEQEDEGVGRSRAGKDARKVTRQKKEKKMMKSSVLDFLAAAARPNAGRRPER